MKKNQIVIFWFRRDLRLEDNAGLHLALKSGFPVLPIFIFDKNILSKLQAKKDARVLFIHREIEKLKTKLEKMGSSLRTYFETPEEAWKKILDEYDVVQVFANRDYESYARERDNSVFSFLKSKGIAFHGSKDHVIFEKNEVLKENGAPYTVFTPYSKKWKSTLRATDYQLFSNKKYEASFLKCPPQVLHSMKEIGFEDFAFPYFPTNEIHHDLISSYHLNRNFPSLNGTTRLSMHLRFGTISLRSLVKIALNENETFLNELIWRDFYQMIIYHFPHSEKNSFKPAYDKIDWNNNPDDFKLWCEGRTGYPIVDAGMRELNETGFMITECA